MTKKQYITMRVDYQIENGTVTFEEIDSDLDDYTEKRIYEMVQDAGSKIARNLRKGLILKVTLDN